MEVITEEDVKDISQTELKHMLKERAAKVYEAKEDVYKRQHMQCVKFTIDRVNKRVPVIAGTGSNCTRTAIDMSKEASEYGADGLLLVTPYYNKATQNGLIGHFSAVAKEVTAPIIMYSVASRTGCNIEPATVARLVKDCLLYTSGCIAAG